MQKNAVPEMFSKPSQKTFIWLPTRSVPLLQFTKSFSMCPNSLAKDSGLHRSMFMYLLQLDTMTGCNTDTVTSCICCSWMRDRHSHIKGLSCNSYIELISTTQNTDVLKNSIFISIKQLS